MIVNGFINHGICGQLMPQIVEGRFIFSSKNPWQVGTLQEA